MLPQRGSLAAWPGRGAGKWQRETVSSVQHLPLTSAKPAEPPAADAAAIASVGARVRARQVEILDGDYLSAAANIPGVMLTGYVLRDSIPAAWLYLWVAATALAIAAFILAIRGPLFWRSQAGRRKGSLQRRLAVHVLFTVVVGGIWGAGCVAFSPLLPQGPMMFLTVIVLGCNAACISALGPYLPAFFGYFFASLLPLAWAYLRRDEPDAAGLALLVILYMITITMNVRAYNRHVLAAFRLRAENEALAENVASANAATAAATQSKWDTLAHLSHELRTPMNAILGFSEMMREQLFGPLGERYLTYSGNIHDSGKHTLDLIDTLLEVSRAEAGQLSLAESEIAAPVLIGECLRMVEPAAAARRLTLDHRSGPAIPKIVIDRAKLRQALLNLLTNAIKYTQEGGRITVAVQIARGGGLDIAVADTGVGIAAEDLGRCLEPFVRLGNPLTAGVEGAGLGLPLAKRLVELHGGSLRIASEPGRGTTVTIHLPPGRCVGAQLRSVG
jgi:two-component system, cell cycle sensor histidine kinase PleC